MIISRRNLLQLGGLSILSSGLVEKVFSNSEKIYSLLPENSLNDIKPLTIEDYEQRLEKSRKLMREKNICGLLIMSGANLSYFTKVQWGESERPFGAILNHKGSPIWICPAFEYGRAIQRIPEGHEIRVWQEDESPYKLIAGIITDLEYSSKKLAVAPNIRSFIIYGLKKDAPNIELIDGSYITEGCRSIKSEKEIEFMKLANKITKIAIKESFKQLKEGLTAEELSKNISSNHQKQGYNGGGMVLLGPNSSFPHGSSNIHNLKKDDLILVDCGCSVEGYTSDVSRTIVFGKATDKQLRVWEIVRKAQQEALRAVKPGVTCGSIDLVARKIIEDSGFGNGYKYFSHRLGHGIGMEGHEYPYLVKDNDLKLEVGMTFSNEPGIYLSNEFGVRTEDCFAVTTEGGYHMGEMEASSIYEPF